MMKPEFPNRNYLLSQIALGVPENESFSPNDHREATDLGAEPGEAIEDLARFYASKSLTALSLPSICVGLCCALRGAEQVATYLEEHPEALGAGSGRLQRVMCMGRCYAGPVVQIAPGRYAQCDPTRVH